MKAVIVGASAVSPHAPLPGETRFAEAGMAYWLFPDKAPFSGERARAVVDALVAGKLPAKQVRDVTRTSAFPGIFVAALEAAGWSFRAMRDDGLAKLGAHGRVRRSDRGTRTRHQATICDAHRRAADRLPRAVAARTTSPSTSRPTCSCTSPRSAIRCGRPADVPQRGAHKSARSSSSRNACSAYGDRHNGRTWKCSTSSTVVRRIATTSGSARSRSSRCRSIGRMWSA